MEKYTPTEQDRHTATRILSDAELLKNGATIENGHLQLSPEQLDDLAIINEGLRPEIGALALHSTRDEELMVPMKELIEAEYNRQHLGDRIHQVLIPYSHIFNDKIPNPNENERSIFGKLKTKERQIPTWTTELIQGSAEIKYTFDISYQPGDNFNLPTVARIGVKNQSSQNSQYPERYDIDLTYENGELSSLSLVEASLVTEIFEQTMGEDTTRRNLGNFLYNCCGVKGTATINLHSKNPSIKFDNSGDRSEDNIEYRYSPKTNSFRLLGKHSFVQWYRGKGYDFKPDPEISVEEFLILTKEMLDLIPTLKYS